jgi:hypothetical protein
MFVGATPLLASSFVTMMMDCSAERHGCLDETLLNFCGRVRVFPSPRVAAVSVSRRDAVTDGPFIGQRGCIQLQRMSIEGSTNAPI